LLLAFLLLVTAPVHAAQFVVDTTVDAVDVLPGDGTCSAAGGECTLRAAIQEANPLAGGDEITLPAGVYALSIPGTDEDAAASGDLDVTDVSGLSIIGAGAGVTIVDAAGIDRVRRARSTLRGRAPSVGVVPSQLALIAGRHLLRNPVESDVSAGAAEQEDEAMSGLRIQLGLVAATLLLALAPGQPSAAQGTVKATQVASGLTNPMYATAPDGDPRLFVVERAGRIRVVKDGVPLETPFLDIAAQISTAGEGGLLGMAFPSDYATSGLFIVYYTDLASDSVVSRFSVTADPDVADAESEELLLFIDQPDTATFHRGGRVHFGPDGFLWLATGDGGVSANAQDPQSLLGKMLRIDVGPIFAPDSIPVAGEAYRIPADNPPFVGTPTLDEIWALGLRNPYSWSFDRLNGDLWIGDVGAAAREEIDFEAVDDPGGRNYGWNLMEGTLCNAAPPPCDDPSLTLPIFEYDHSGGECSIIGGYVFRQSSAVSGLYFFGDWCTGRVWSLNGADLSVVDRTDELGAAGGVGFSLVGFGEDGMGRLLLVNSRGRVYRIDPVRRPQLRCGIGPELVAVLGMLAWVRRLRRA
jgi:CSLREA domain-containing protein